MEKRKSCSKLNNTGAALVTVIVVIGFISVFATVVLYMSGINFYMKSTDMKIKESFYDGEKGLEEIKARLMVDAAEAFETAYNKTIFNYSTSAAAQRQSNYKKFFVGSFKDKWNGKTNAEILEYLKSSASLKYTRNFNSITGVDDTGAFVFNVVYDEAEGTVTLENVTLIYTVEDYTTRITTDFVITAPDIDMEVSKNMGVAPGGSDDEPKTVEMSDCVSYQNWTKQ